MCLSSTLPSILSGATLAVAAVGLYYQRFSRQEARAASKEACICSDLLHVLDDEKYVNGVPASLRRTVLRRQLRTIGVPEKLDQELERVWRMDESTPGRRDAFRKAAHAVIDWLMWEG